jgi:hypothetical protein
MRIEHIEEVLGSACIDEMHTALERAYLQSRRTPQGPAALADLLLAQIASIIDVGCGEALALDRAEYCADRLIALVQAMVRVDQSTRASTDGPALRAPSRRTCNRSGTWATQKRVLSS